jgi:hypothetical protein
MKTGSVIEKWLFAMWTLMLANRPVIVLEVSVLTVYAVGLCKNNRIL